MALSFVPTELLGMLPDDMPPEFDTFLGFSSLLGTLEPLFVITPLHDTHNKPRMFEGMFLNRTNNYVEAFHFSFKRLVGHSNPKIWGFISAMKLQQSTNL